MCLFRLELCVYTTFPFVVVSDYVWGCFASAVFIGFSVAFVYIVQIFMLAAGYSQHRRCRAHVDGHQEVQDSIAQVAASSSWGYSAQNFVLFCATRVHGVPCEMLAVACLELVIIIFFGYHYHNKQVAYLIVEIRFI